MISGRGRNPRGLITLLEIVGSVPEIAVCCRFWYWSYYRMGVGGFMSQLVPVDTTKIYSMVCTQNKIFKINKDRALEIMWIADAVYDELGYCSYKLVSRDMNRDEWAMIAPYFDPNTYRAERVIALLKWEVW